MFDETFFVLVAFVIFIAVMVYLKVPAMLTKGLDERAERIKRELEEAEKLHREAKALFEDYRQKQANAIKEAAEIVAHAEAEAKRMAVQAEADLKTSLERRRAMAEQKIAQAEAQAIREVREAAVDVAIAAAETILAKQLQGASAGQMMDSAIADAKSKLH